MSLETEFAGPAPVLTDLTELDPVRRPVGQALGLPSRFYTDPGLHELEKRRLFHAGWAGIGFEQDVPEPGAMMPVDFLGVPLLMVRGRDGAVRVFENVCRHRGMCLVDAPRSASMIRCPYHSWTYGLDGALKATPHVGGPGVGTDPRISTERPGLNEVRAHGFLGVVFVNLSGDAPAFDEAHAALRARWAPFADLPLFSSPDSIFGLEVAGNWKLALENYCESYHLPFVHPGLNSYSRLEDHYNIVEPGAFSGQGSTVYAPTLSDDGRGFAPFPGVDGFWRQGAEYIALYPNVLFGVHRDHAYAMLLAPRGPDRCVERVVLNYASPEMAGEDFAALRARNVALWTSVFAEDVDVVEGMQRGRAALAFDGGVFSEAMDGPTHNFHLWVAERMAG